MSNLAWCAVVVGLFLGCAGTHGEGANGDAADDRADASAVEGGPSIIDVSSIDGGQGVDRAGDAGADAAGDSGGACTISCANGDTCSVPPLSGLATVLSTVLAPTASAHCIDVAGQLPGQLLQVVAGAVAGQAVDVSSIGSQVDPATSKCAWLVMASVPIVADGCTLFAVFSLRLPATP